MKIKRINKGAFEEINHHISQSEPFILVNYAETWPAIKKWDHNYFCSNLKDYWVKYKRSSSHIHPDFISDRLEQYHEGSIKDYLNYLYTLSEQDRAHYFLSGDHLRMFHYGKTNPILKQFFQDITYPEFIYKKDIVSMGMWLSFNGVFSWLHYDDNDAHNFNVQIRGSKYVKLFHPDEVQNLYINSALDTPHYNFSKINLEEINLDKYPLFKNARHYEGTICQGDMLFIPMHWLHSFKHLGDLNINVNFWWEPNNKQADRIFNREKFICDLIKNNYPCLLEEYKKLNNRKFNLYHGIDFVKDFIKKLQNDPLINAYKSKEESILMQ